MQKLERPDPEGSEQEPRRDVAGFNASTVNCVADKSPAAPPAADGEEDEEVLFAECFRMAQSFLATQPALVERLPPHPISQIATSAETEGNINEKVVVSSGLGFERSVNDKAIVPFPISLGLSLGPIVSSKKRNRSNEMVRVSVGGPLDRLYFRQLVRRTRATFESLRMLLICKEEEDARTVGLTGGKRHRADLKAAALMMQRGLWLNREKRVVGPLQGIRVGDVFFFRIELCVVGLHGQVQAGIDHVPAAGSSTGEPIATSIVVSGGYEDDEDKGETLIYTGHGGRTRNLHRQCIDQKLAGGNLALERSCAYGIEIRVIRGLKSDRSPTGRIYVYDGLYKIDDYWSAIGKSGFVVLKYKLVRLENQAKMGSTAFKLAEELRSNMLSVRPAGTLSLDISGGKETLPVSLFNDVDGDDEPLRYGYLARRPNPPNKSGEVTGGCRCVIECSGGCDCARKNGGELPYDSTGALLRGRPLVYECGSSCSCPATCRNRVTQSGLRRRMEVFKSWERGWAVRPLELIKAGTFVCEFAGVVVDGQHFDLVNSQRFTPRWAEWGDLSKVLPHYHPPPVCLPPPGFSMDVASQRNLACYLIRSHSPNVFPQLVVHGGGDPHLMIFALENIPPMRELSVDYGVGDGWFVSQR